MAPTRHSVLALLSLAASVRAAPAGPIKDRQIGLTPPSQSVSWDTGSPAPTGNPQESYPPVSLPKTSVPISLDPPSVTWDVPLPSPTPVYPPVNPSSAKPSEASSDSPSYSISWSKDDPTTSAPVVPKPSDQISLGKPTFWVSWETSGPAPSEPPTVPDYPPAQPSDQISLGKPSYSISWDGQEPPSATPIPTPTPPKTSKKPEYPPWTPMPPLKSSQKPTPVPVSSQKPSSTPKSSDGPNYSVTWVHAKREDSVGFAVKPTYTPIPPKSSSVVPKSSSSKPKPSSTKPKSTSKPTPKPTPTPTPTPTPDYPEDPEPTPEDPEPTPPNTIGLEPPTASISWAKREAAPQNSIGLVLPSGISINWPKPSSPGYFTWGKRQEDEEPTEIPEFPFPKPTDEVSQGDPQATVSWGKREAEPQNTIGLSFPPGLSWSWPKPTPPTYVSWGKRDDDDYPAPTPKPTHITPSPKPPVPSSTSCADATVTVVPPCVPPYCSVGVPCDWKLPVPVLEKRVKSVEIIKTYYSIQTSEKPTPVKPTPVKPTPSASKCAPTKTTTIFASCPTYTCVPTHQCDPAQIVR